VVIRILRRTKIIKVVRMIKMGMNLIFLRMENRKRTNRSRSKKRAKISQIITHRK